MGASGRGARGGATMGLSGALLVAGGFVLGGPVVCGDPCVHVRTSMRSPPPPTPTYTTAPHRLSNQGATCYLNSLIQTLYMTPELRRAIYEWRFEHHHHRSASVERFM